METLTDDAETHGNPAETQWNPLGWRQGPAGTCHLDFDKHHGFGTYGNQREPFHAMRKPMKTRWKPNGNPWIGEQGLLAHATEIKTLQGRLDCMGSRVFPYSKLEVDWPKVRRKWHGAWTWEERDYHTL